MPPYSSAGVWIAGRRIAATSSWRLRLLTSCSACLGLLLSGRIATALRARWRHARRLAGLLAVVRRPRRVPEAICFLPCRELEQRVERSRDLVDAGMAIADGREPRRHRRQREVAR